MSTALPPFLTERSFMADRYPMLRFETIERDGTDFAVWEGWLTPIRDRSQLDGVLADLDADRTVMIDADATLLHHSACDLKHPRHRLMARLKRPDRSFKVRIEYAGGVAHPRAYLLDPVITPANRKHIFNERRICAYLPSDDVWVSGRDSVADFTDHVLVWLLKRNTWVEAGHWPGSEMSHDPMLLFTTISAQAQCWCGTGESYSHCHRELDRGKVSAELTQMLIKSSRFFQFPRYDEQVRTRIRAFRGRS